MIAGFKGASKQVREARSKKASAKVHKKAEGEDLAASIKERGHSKTLRLIERGLKG